MLKTIIRKEILAHILTLRFSVAFMLLLLLTFATFFMMVRGYQREASLSKARAGEYRSQLDDMLGQEDGRKRDGALFYDQGLNYSLRIPELSWLGQGVVPLSPAGVNITEHGSRPISRETRERPLAVLFRPPDYIYVVTVMMSLLAFLLGFDMVCGEKEAGTLRLILTNSVPRGTLLLGKLVAGVVVLLVPFLIATLGGLGYAWTQGVLPLESTVLQCVLLIVVGACLCTLTFFSLSVLVSSLTHRSSTALFLCLLLWVLLVVIAPSLSAITAITVRSVPSQKKLDSELKAIGHETRLRLDQLRSSGQLAYGAEMEKKQEEIREDGERQKQRWVKHFDEMKRGQMDLAFTLGRISPSTSFTLAATSLCGTAPDYIKRIRKARDRAQKDFREFIDQYHRERRKTGEHAMVIEYHDLPVLNVVGQGAQEAVQGALNDMLLLVVESVLLFMAAFMCFIRYDAR